jgi:hypothetical protein
VVFKLSRNGTETVLQSFPADVNDGEYPNDPLILDSEGNLYGTTSGGEAQGTGTVFKRADYRIEGKRARLRLLEKGNKEKLVWLHHKTEQFLDAWLAEAHIEDGEQALFQTLGKTHRLTGEAMSRRDYLRLVPPSTVATCGLPYVAIPAER